MKRILILFTLVILISCSKEKSIERKLDGNWLVTKVRIQDGEGFIYDDTIPSGEMIFNTQNKLVSGKIMFDYSTISLVSLEDSLLLNDFQYQLNSDAGRFYANSPNLQYDFRILSITKSDLQIEYYDLQKYQMKRFVLKKKE
ncbi:MAG: hypothetical protein FJZ67_10900 [Bacteroidetes bacterium]|nr:hypothetical protein [Bacteroidota bacterium]